MDQDKVTHEFWIYLDEQMFTVVVAIGNGLDKARIVEARDEEGTVVTDTATLLRLDKKLDEPHRNLKDICLKARSEMLRSFE